MKKYINKKSIIITSIIFLLLVTVGTTLAFVFTETDPIENTFLPSKVSCAVVEADGIPVSGAIVETGKAKTNVKIKNTGDTAAYIRVDVIVNWTSEDGSRVWAMDPVRDTDYEISYNLDDGWFEGSDGFYYYSRAISPDTLTNVLIEHAALKNGVTAPIGTDNTQYYFSIEIIASAIQSTPTSTVFEQWGVNVNEDGTISK